MPRVMTLDHETFIVLPKQEYQELLARAHGVTLPAYPRADGKGHRQAIAFARTSVAREVITRRLAAGWTQEQLARKAKVRVETISRLETGKHHPQQTTIEKIDQTLNKAGI